MGEHMTGARIDEDAVEAAMKPVSSPVPKARKASHPVHVDPRRVPTVEDVLDPVQPDLEQADGGTAIEAITGLVDDLYSKVLEPKQQEVRAELAKKPPPPSSSLASKLVEMAVEAVVSSLFGRLGNLAIGAVRAGGEHGHHEGGGEEGSESVKELGKGAGKAAGEAAGERARPEQEGPERPELEVHVTASHDMLDEYFERIPLQLVVKRADAIGVLRQLRASALANPHELAALDRKLHDLIKNTAFVDWYMHELTMGWMNFTARLSLGGRKPGQHTDMLGANELGGVREGGEKATVAWRGSHDGFVDVRLRVSKQGTPEFASAMVAGGPGASKLLKNAGNDRDHDGSHLTLANLPVYRRIWLTDGDSALDINPAFVITPEGAIEANLDDPLLARLGGGGADAMHDFTEAFDERAHRDQEKPSRPTHRATQGMAGARAVLVALAGKTPEVLQ
jgi:hypothetical protein